MISDQFCKGEQKGCFASAGNIKHSADVFRPFPIAGVHPFTNAAGQKLTGWFIPGVYGPILCGNALGNKGHDIPQKLQIILIVGEAVEFIDGILYLSLVRGTTYCAHPIEDRMLIPDDRYTKKMDQGEHNYFFRLTACDEISLDRKANEFNRKPYAVNVFPLGERDKESDFPVV